MRAANVELQAGEQLMSDADELIFRQMAPHMFEDDGKIASTVFGPSTADMGKPSYSRATLVSAQEARDWYSIFARLPSLGVYALSVGEVIASGLNTVDDSGCPLAVGQNRRAPGHCFVDFRGLAKPQKKELRARLYIFAMMRGEIPTDATPKEGQLFV